MLSYYLLHRRPRELDGNRVLGTHLKLLTGRRRRRAAVAGGGRRRHAHRRAGRTGLVSPTGRRPVLTAGYAGVWSPLGLSELDVLLRPVMSPGRRGAALRRHDATVSPPEPPTADRRAVRRALAWTPQPSSTGTHLDGVPIAATAQERKRRPVTACNHGTVLAGRYRLDERLQTIADGCGGVPSTRRWTAWSGPGHAAGHPYADEVVDAARLAA